MGYSTEDSNAPSLEQLGQQLSLMQDEAESKGVASVRAEVLRIKNDLIVCKSNGDSSTEADELLAKADKLLNG